MTDAPENTELLLLPKDLRRPWSCDREGFMAHAEEKVTAKIKETQVINRN